METKNFKRKLLKDYSMLLTKKMFFKEKHLRSKNYLILQRLVLIALIIFCVHIDINAQNAQRTNPNWWYGISGAANMNFYDGTTKMLNSSILLPNSLHDGFGVGPFGAMFIECYSGHTFGGMMNIGFNSMRGEFYKTNNPKEDLSTSISYLSIEPSLRISPFSSGFYLFIGPGFNINMSKSFEYRQAETPEINATWSEVRKSIFTGQIGAGYDIPLTSNDKKTQIKLSPFVAYITSFGHEIRNVEEWSITTVRVGLALKFGCGKEIQQAMTAPVVTPKEEPKVKFSIEAPKTIQLKCKVRETLPLRNYVFFSQDSTQIPNRYVLLTKDQAANFKEEDMLSQNPKDMTCRSPQQMYVYYNILNIVGDRLRRNPGASITLIGASSKGTEVAKTSAESVKRYLVDVFEINSARITTEGRLKPRIPSEETNGKLDKELCRVEDNRVDIESNSPELLTEFGDKTSMNPVQIISMEEDPLENHVFFKATGAKESLSSWSVDITDDKGNFKHIGPITEEQENISGKTILGDNTEGDFKIIMVGQTNSGELIKKENVTHLEVSDKITEEELRYSILFDFDKSKTVETYRNFLANVVVPHITDSATVIIHGHTDIIGEEDYNKNLSINRGNDAMTILQQSVANSGVKGVNYIMCGFGEDVRYTPFDNNLPEERCYNRTVIIEITPNKNN